MPVIWTYKKRTPSLWNPPYEEAGQAGDVFRIELRRFGEATLPFLRVSLVGFGAEDRGGSVLGFTV